jgi:hypothetical protein
MIERLIVVAAPSAAGKTIFIEELRANHFQEFSTRLGVRDLREWHYVSRGSIKEAKMPKLTGLVVFECNITGAYYRRASYHQDQPTVHVLQQAREISFVTLWTPPARLLGQRSKKEWRKPLRAPLSILSLQRLIVLLFLRVLPRSLTTGAPQTKFGEWLLNRPTWQGFLRKRFRFYSHPAEIVGCYREWLHFCDHYAPQTRDHLIVEFDETLKFYSRDEWEKMVRVYL